MRECMKKCLQALLFPHTAVVLGGIPVTAALMYYVFALGHESEPMAYVAYLISAYAMTVLCIWCVKNAKPTVQSIKKLLRKNRYIDRYMSDKKFSSLINLNFSALANILYAVMKLCMGIYYQSVWFLTFAVYYALLLAMRLLLMRGMTPETLGTNLVLEKKRYRACAIMLMFMNMALTGMVVLAIHDNEGVRYPGMLIYAVAAYDFYIITMAIINLVKVRKHGSPILSASKVISLAAAMIAMLSLEMAMLAEFNTQDDMFRNMMIGLTGFGISIIFIVTAVIMLVFSGKKEAQNDTYSGCR